MHLSVACFVTLVLSFGLTLVILDVIYSNSELCLQANRTILSRPYFPLEGHAYKASAPLFKDISDNEGNLFRSPIILCEGDKVLGPAHTFHAEIVKNGSGRFSHYENDVVFSSSDNSDPNLNGRVYALVVK